MTLGMDVCPKCEGHGLIRYRVWDTQIILSFFVAFKSGVPAERLDLELLLLKMRCPLCDGDGIHDFVRGVMRAKVVESFNVVKGNMDIYCYNCANKWVYNPSRYQIKNITIKNMFKTPDKLIEFSQQHYTGIKLNKRILSMSLNEISDLSEKSADYIMSLIDINRDDGLNEEKLKNAILDCGLSKYIPDEIAIPGPYDYMKD
jgi:hypothetical protein